MKSCVSWLNETESFVTLLLNESADEDLVVVKAVEGPPTCKGPIVDYKIDENDIFLRNGTYSVRYNIIELKLLRFFKFFTFPYFFIHKLLSLVA